MVSLYGRDFVMLMELYMYICCHVAESVHLVFHSYYERDLRDFHSSCV